jgi:nucleotide-binding universal stress UspA family protein
MPEILCPLDFSEESLNAAKYAAVVAIAINTSVTLLHLEPEWNQVLNVERKASGFEAGSKFRLSETAAQLRNDYGVECRFEFDYSSDIVRDISEWMRSSAFGLLVMGTQGSRSLAEAYMGSRTGQLANAIQGVLLSVPKGAEIKLPKHIIFAVDKAEESKAHLLEVITFARALGSDVSLLHVSKPNEAGLSSEFMNEVANSFGNPEWLKFRNEEHSDVLEVISNAAPAGSNNMVAVMSHYKSVDQAAFHNSMSRSLVEQLEVPVLVFHL